MRLEKKVPGQRERPHDPGRTHGAAPGRRRGGEGREVVSQTLGQEETALAWMEGPTRGRAQRPQGNQGSRGNTGLSRSHADADAALGSGVWVL